MSEKRAKFTQMKDGDADDYSIIAASNAKDYDHLADKVIDHLMMLEHDYGGFRSLGLHTASKPQQEHTEMVRIMNMLYVL